DGIRDFHVTGVQTCALPIFDIAVPLSILVSITVAGIVVVQDRKKIHVKSAGWLLLATLFGTPIGLILLTSGNEQVVKICLGAVRSEERRVGKDARSVDRQRE